MYGVGSCVLLRESCEGYFRYLDIPIEDIHLWDREFKNNYGKTINQYLADADVNLEANFIIKILRNKKYRVVNAQGKERTVSESDILMEGEPYINNPNFESWNLLSIVERGSADACPISPHPQDFRPRAYHIDGYWYGLAFSSGTLPASTRNQNPKKEVEQLYPKNKWKDIKDKKLIVGLPWCDAWKPRISESRVGIGYHVSLPLEDVSYSNRKIQNRLALEKGVQTFEADGKAHFYIPINRLQPKFHFPVRKESRSWFAINWCPRGFKHLMTANA